jgi:hypothetical protein
MKRCAQILIGVICTMFAAGMVAAQPSNVDTATSAKLTKYLHNHRLPMVGAQISNTEAGRQLMLYGFVASDFGKDDAVTKSKTYLHDSTIAVTNNIRVNPQLKHLKHSQSSPASDESSSDPMDSGMSPPPRADWENTFDNTLRSGGVTPSNDPALNMPAPGGPAPVPPGGMW